MKIFYQTYPLISLRNAIKRDFAFSIFLGLFLYIFRPFGLHFYGPDHNYVFVGYGIVTLLTSLTNDFIFFSFFTNYFKRNNFLVFHQIIFSFWYFVSLGISNFIFAIYLKAFPLNILSFFKIQSYVILIAFLPILLYTLLKQNYLLKRNLSEAYSIGKELEDSKLRLSPSSNNPETDKSFAFYSDNEKEMVSILPSKLLYLNSQDNYVEFFWYENSTIHKKLLRNTLTFFENQLSDDRHFFRCHRAYIINLSLISSISGNSQGYYVSFDGLDHTIPVSRSKGKLIKTALHNQDRALL